MRAIDCPRFESCSAPICPVDEGSISTGIWFPGEDICFMRLFCKEIWIRNQKKISKRSRNTDTFFTYRMLNNRFVVGKAISGLNADSDLSSLEMNEEFWFKHHPPRHTLSNETKVKLQKNMVKIRQRVHPLQLDTIQIENSVSVDESK